MISSYPVASLLLDESNPRFAEPVDSQHSAINALLTDGFTKLVNLAEDIAREGAVNPTELPVVVEENGELIVIEGNRRLAALKLLRNPELADDPAHKRRFKAIAETGIGPDELFCYLAESREDAKHWIDLRHTGQNAGVGVVEWEAWQSNNFRRRRGSQADRAAVFCDAVIRDFPDQPELRADVQTVRRDRLTTLGRLVADPDVRHEFGFDFDYDDVIFHFDHEHLLQGFQRIFGDLAGEVGVSQIKSKEQRQSYIKDSASDLPPRSKRLGQPRNPGARPAASSNSPGDGQYGGSGEGGLGATTTPEASGQPKATRRTMPRTERVIFQGLTLRKVDLRTSKLLQQAQKIDIDSTPAVAGVLVRVVVELVVTYAAQKLNWPVAEKDSLKKKIAAAVLALDPNASIPPKRDKSLEPVWIRTQDEGAVLVQTMNSFVHNIMTNPTAAEVRELSQTFRVLLERLDQLLAEDPTT